MINVQRLESRAVNDETFVLNRVGAFDQATLGQIYDAYYERIYHYIYHRLGDASLAEDMAGEVFLRMLESIRGERAWHSSLTGWLYRIAHNLVIDHYRKIQSRQGVSLLAEPANEEVDSSSLTHVSGCVQPMLARLADDYRKALEQTDLGDKTQAEFAREVGLSLAGAKSRVQRARAQLGAAIQHCCTPEVDATGTMIDHGCNCQPPHYCRDKQGRCGSS